MVDRTQPISVAVIATGVVALAFVLALTLGPVLAILWVAEPSRGLQPSDWAALRFTLIQASLSALLSVLLAIPLARALARRRFAGRGLVMALLGAPFLLPAIVAIFGLLAIWGRSGVVSKVLMQAGSERIDIYGLSGVVLAHVFFNLPLVTRFLLQGWQAIPAEHFRLAAELGMGPRQIFRRLEWPMLRAVVPGAFLLVFLLCMTSFAVALALGGGPKATTVELAIFQALRFDFDLGNAAKLALIQLAICGLAAALSLGFTRRARFGRGLSRVVERWDVSGPGMWLGDLAVILALMAFLGLPLAVIILRGIPAIMDGLPAGTLAAVRTSLSVAFGSAALTFALAMGLAVLTDALHRQRRRRAWLVEGVGLMALAVSPFVIGTGLFIALNPVVDPFSLALPVTAAINAAVSLPFALRVIVPALASARREYGMLADSLGMAGFSRFKLVLWPLIRRPVGFAIGLAAAFSMGDLGVIALFAPPDGATLPLFMYRLMGAYQMQAAAGVALLLLTLTLTVFWIFDRGGRIGHSV